MLSLICVAALAVAVSGSPAPAPRVSGGAPAAIAQHPYAAALLFSTDTVTQQHLGTATVINNRSVLTLASWIYDLNTAFAWHLRLGSSYANSGGDVYEAVTVILHPSWNYDPLTSDIALVRIATSFVFGMNVQPTAIAGPDYILPDGTPVVTIGWGQTYSGSERSEELQEVAMQTIDRETCASAWEERGVELASDMMCAGDPEEGKGLCTWDFGGPLLHTNVVIGVATYTQPCGQAPTLYTRVSNFTSWIVANA